MKKNLIIALAALMVVFAGCQKKQVPPETTTAEQTSESEAETTESQAATDPTETTESESATVSATTAAEVKSVKGTVSDATMNTVILLLEDGTTMEFHKEGVEVVSDDGLNIDDKIEVFYEGSTAVKIVELEK